MKKIVFRRLLGIMLLVTGFQVQLSAQVITAGQDSAVVRQPGDTVVVKTKGWSKPGKAALMSALLPGLGQAYNGSYWKIPIIYVGGLGMGYAIYLNHHKYLIFRQAYTFRTDNDDSTVDRFVTGPVRYGQATTLKRGRDQYRRWRDLSMLYSLLAYGMNITEAYVHAHLKGFDISDELTLQVQPSFIATSATAITPAFTLRLNLRK